ncbi:MAG: glycosyltransferase family 4 protein [Candidatus Aminicenantes bacterium]|nr:glycosyltransferase family 4 protein [Candidatus Aminicenantes bacterium]
MSLFQIDAGREWGGEERQSFLLTRELVEQGFAVCLVVHPGSPLHAKAEAEGLPVLPIKMKGDDEIGAAYKLSRAMRKHHCVLAHFHGARAVSSGGAVCARAKVPIRAVSRQAVTRLRTGFFSKRKFTQDVDLIVAVSERVRDVLIHGGIAPDKIEVIPSGLNFGAFDGVEDRGLLRREFGFSPDDFLAGIEATLEDSKGYGYLIEAARMLKARAPKIKLIILGRGPLELAQDKQARDLGAGDLVFFLGFHQDAPRILASLDVFVVSSEREGQGGPIMDAMASRLPVVATQVGGIPEVVLHDETGLLVLPRSPRALAEAIYAIYKDPELARRFGERGRQVVHERFSSLAMARKTIALYKRIAYRKMVKLGP